MKKFALLTNYSKDKRLDDQDLYYGKWRQLLDTEIYQ